MVMSWQYIAGFFDGEGSIGLGAHNTGRKAVVYMAQSGRLGLSLLHVISKFLATEGVKSSVFETGRTGVHGRTMPSYRLNICGYASVVTFVLNVLPYLYIKKVVAQDIIRYNKLFPNIQKSPLTRAWRSERMRACALRGEAWHNKFDGRVTGRPRGSKNKA